MAFRSRFRALADHPWLVGGSDVPGRKIARRARWMTIVAILLANAIGAAVVISFAVFGLPKPDLEDSGDAVRLNVALAAGYTTLALLVGARWGARSVERGRHGVRAWLEADRPPTTKERRVALRAPLRIMVIEVVLWGGAVLLFTLLNLKFDALLSLGVGCTVALGGVTTSAAAYLLCELAFRPVAARALAGGADQRSRRTSVATRWLVAWALGTGVPVFGLMLVGIVALTPVDITSQALAITVVALTGIGLGFGAFVTGLAAYATVHPLASIRHGLDRVRSGDLDAEVGVWDTTEVGLLQAGFNDMVRGLQEREKLRDVFGRQVGEDVARQALEGEIRLGGETREVTVLFVDLIGSTTLAAERDAEEVVALLNRFFAAVVEVVEDCGGWINKFEGDAALAVFGAPVAVDDAAGQGLKAARALAERLPVEVPELQAGIGVATGKAVAGNVGAEHRFEYTVIGDPVNEAARLTDLAKEHDPPVLASQAAVDAASRDEAARWHLGEEQTLRGRTRPTRLARPRGAA